MAAHKPPSPGRGGRTSPARRVIGAEAKSRLTGDVSAGARVKPSRDWAGRRPAGKLRDGGFHGPDDDRPRNGVPELQLARMLHAMAEVCRERGSAPAPVSEVCGRSRISRRTFYEMFSDKEDCFLAALEEATSRAAAQVVPAYSHEREWLGAVRAGLRALLCFLDEDTVFGHLLIVQSLAAGPAALQFRAKALKVAIAAVDRGRKEGRPSQAVTGTTAEGTVNAVLGILHERMQAGASAPLSCLSGELMCLVALPYFGPAAARRELERPLPKPANQRRPAAREDALANLKVRLTYRTIRVLQAIESSPGASNREVSTIADILDQGQASKLLARLARAGAIRNLGSGSSAGERNSWHLTDLGAAVAREVGGAVP